VCLGRDYDGLNTRFDLLSDQDTENEQQAAVIEEFKKNLLPHGVMVAQLVLIQSVQVQILVG
jgi:hypothetical protein